jgi:transaldolase
MKLFLDTANLEEIRKANDWGILDGVTTNPSHVSKENIPFISLVKQICEMMGDRPVSAEVVATDAEGIIKEARKLTKVAKNIVVKVPVIREGIKAVSVLSREGIKTNVTLNFSAVQALFAAKAGATYISPFIGRLDFAGQDGMALVREIRTIYDHYGFKTQIITAAVRHPQHVLQAALAGSHVTTSRLNILEQCFEHPMTDAGLKMFMDDWNSIPEKLRKF